MMTKFLACSILVFAGHAITIHAGATESAPTDLIFTTDLVLGSAADESEYFFGSVSSVIEDSSGNIFVADRDQECIFEFSPDGTFLKKMGRIGDGPGDLMPMFTLGVDARDRIYIVGQGERVEIVDTEWNYLASFRRENPGSIASGLALLTDGAMVIAAANTANHTTLDLYGPAHDHLVSFSPTYAAGTDSPAWLESIHAGGKVAATIGGRLLYAQKAPYSIRIFDRSGTLQVSTSEGGEDFVGPPPKPEQDGETIKVRTGAMSTGIAPLPGGATLVSSIGRGADGGASTLFCLYDEGLKLIGRQEMPGYEFVVGFTPEGKVYLFRRSEDGNMVVRSDVAYVRP